MSITMQDAHVTDGSLLPALYLTPHPYLPVKFGSLDVGDLHCARARIFTADRRSRVASMPTYQGITVSLQSQYDARTIPERILRSSPAAAATFNSQVVGANYKAHKDFESSTVNVSIPIYPNSQFWISYDCLAAAQQQQQQEQGKFHHKQDLAPIAHISSASPTTRYFFFKLLVNKTPIVSWGVGVKENWHGKKFFALQGAGSDFDGKGVVEKKGFFFPSIPACGINAASAGPGLGSAQTPAFEISVFRALARRREAVKRACASLTLENEVPAVNGAEVQYVAITYYAIQGRNVANVRSALTD